MNGFSCWHRPDSNRDKEAIRRRDDQPRRASTGTLEVATVAFVNGADNIGSYAPLFAISSAPRVIVVVAVLSVLLAAWCCRLSDSSAKAVSYTLQRWGHWIVPVVLIALGVYILVT